MMRRLILVTAIFSFPVLFFGQAEAVVQEGEFGVGIGAGHYFGDLNTRAHVNRPKFAMSAFFRKSNHFSQ